ncbi:hypothetical protein KDL01_10150 [Actinospica durhamensis]|uniref:Uncharacterized protein n=1 Tax=Actinospica durhamensis TaxID=1508375 RepID=A0A941EL43_9ACTN|nr:hypothetical protein [Actinospica durhamensis]MBR7833627.1 hypothetical protein [Actinospica durhamensis]
MPDYRARCADGVAGTVRLYQELFSDLDPIRGGFGWWHGHLDQARSILAGDYLISVCEQVSQCLTRAAWHEKTFNEAWFAEARWMRAALATGREQAPHERSEMDEQRAVRIETSLDGFFQACGSVLDNLAAVAIGTLGLSTDLVTADWNVIGKAAGGEAKLLQAPTSPGRTVQDKAVERIQHSAAAGPDGWLRWTIGMRNLLVHRGRRMQVRYFYRVKQRPGAEPEYVLLLTRNPQLTEIEDLALGLGIDSMMLREHAGNTMAGVLARLNTLTVEAMEIFAQVWTARRADPALLPPPEGLWKQLYPKKRDLSGFNGFSDTVPMSEGEMRVSPDMARRFQSAKVLDGPRDIWVGLLGS